MQFTSISSKALAATLLLLSSSVQAHMIMSSPVPYGKSTLDNSPLVASGSDFPCKQRSGVYDLEGASNVMAIGEPQTLSFIGSAVHGGGSCQVSLTTDLQPSADTKWMVIKSIEGGCPANVTGNLPTNAAGTSASSFEYTIPEGVAPGDYTIAWSWINKIGNREFYMNCGPATVTAAKKKRYAPAPKVSKRQTSFPDMFVANLVSVNSCTTPEDFDYNYPNPGSDVQSAGVGPYTTLACAANNAVATAQTPTGAAASGAATAASAASEVSSAAGSSAPSVNPVSASGFAAGSAAATGAAPEATSTAIVSPLPAATSAAVGTSAVSAPAPAATGSSGSSSTVAGTACTDEGAWSCASDGSSFQRCASGEWSASMDMATGTTCTPGVSDTFNMVAGKARRSEGHVRRSHQHHNY